MSFPQVEEHNSRTQVYHLESYKVRPRVEIHSGDPPNPFSTSRPTDASPAPLGTLELPVPSMGADITLAEGLDVADIDLHYERMKLKIKPVLMLQCQLEKSELDLYFSTAAFASQAKDFIHETKLTLECTPYRFRLRGSGHDQGPSQRVDALHTRHIHWLSKISAGSSSIS